MRIGGPAGRPSGGLVARGGGRIFDSVRSVLQVVCAVLAAVALAPALAHVLELPGKLRLARESYLTVQTIYYPGFTIAGGIGEAGGLLSTLVLLLLTPSTSDAFWLTLLAFACLIGMQAVYWIVIQPVNKRWLEQQKLQGIGAAFFSLGGTTTGSWSALRDRWEYAHAARAALALLALLALLLGMKAGA
jgi:hypothetical protein